MMVWKEMLFLLANMELREPQFISLTISDNWHMKQVYDMYQKPYLVKFHDQNLWKEVLLNYDYFREIIIFKSLSWKFAEIEKERMIPWFQQKPKTLRENYFSMTALKIPWKWAGQSQLNLINCYLINKSQFLKL